MLRWTKLSHYMKRDWFMLNSGIYCIKNIKTSKVYIGSSIDIKRRKREHFSRLKKRVHNNIYLQRAYNKYGADNFFFYVIEYIKDVERLIKVEQLYLDKFESYNYKLGYNICNRANSNLGTKKTQKQVLNQIKSRGAKPFFVYDLLGNCLGRFLNKKEASMFIGIKPSSTNVLQCLKWQKKTLNGKICIYEHEIDMLEERLTFCTIDSSKPFLVANSNFSIFNIYTNQSLCARDIGLSNKTINKTLAGNNYYKQFYMEFL